MGLQDGTTTSQGYIAVAFSKGKTPSKETLQAFKSFCEPDNVDSIQLNDVFIKWLKNNPERRQLATHVLFYAAMADVYPCKP